MRIRRRTSTCSSPDHYPTTPDSGVGRDLDEIFEYKLPKLNEEERDHLRRDHSAPQVAHLHRSLQGLQ
jgi:hypothetical protein